VTAPAGWCGRPTGPLTDKGVEPGERQARSDLFAGAIGSYKNSQSHRDVARRRSERVSGLFFVVPNNLAEQSR
jgi:hypothetical protein